MREKHQPGIELATFRFPGLCEMMPNQLSHTGQDPSLAFPYSFVQGTEKQERITRPKKDLNRLSEEQRKLKKLKKVH